MRTPLEKGTAREFRAWLQTNTALGDRSISDVVSRLRRVSLVVDPLKADSPQEFRRVLGSTKGSSDWSPFVRSQLGRAGILFRQFSGMDD